ncbi:MAG TPA: MFS transporter, partial [Gemmatimonadales bacterium]|nr:MFS transporter [Gemmatimonadales bacterium]
RDLWTLAIVIPLVPIGTALLFPATTSLMSRASDPREVGTTMGVAQTFAGLARVAAPVLATVAFQRLGHGWPFFIAAGYVALVGIMAFQVHVHRRVAVPAGQRGSGAGISRAGASAASSDPTEP